MNVLAEIEKTLKQEIVQAIINAKLATEKEIPSIILEKPKEKQHGEFAANIDMQLARVAKMAPRQIAEKIIEKIDKTKAGIDSIEIAGPGFINFFMKDDFLTGIISTVIAEQENYGRSNAGNNKRVQ